MMKLFRKSFAIPYEDTLTPPSEKTAKKQIALYCAQENLSYEFTGKSEDDNLLVTIDGKTWEVLRGIGRGQCGYGGYGISCREY